MKKQEVEEIIQRHLCELSLGKESFDLQITSETVPLEELGFFDSLLALEVSVMFEGEFNSTWGDENLFIDEKSKKARTVSEIAERITCLLGESKRK